MVFAGTTWRFARSTTPRAFFRNYNHPISRRRNGTVVRSLSASQTNTTTTSRRHVHLGGGPASRPNVSFKVARVSFADGATETINLESHLLLKHSSIYVRDLFFTLNLTTRKERMNQPKTLTRRSSSAILPRKDAIVVSFGNIRAVIGLEDALLFDAHDQGVRTFAGELQQALKPRPTEASPSDGSMPDPEPKELIALELILREGVDSFHRRLRLFEPIVYTQLDKVDKHDFTSPDATIHQLGPLKDALQSFQIQVHQSEECLEDLLNHDDLMLSLLLTEQNAASLAGKKVEFSRHEDVELMLGVYAREISNIHAEVSFLLQRLQSKQEFVAIALSGYRNRMVRMNVLLAIAGLSLGWSTAIAGIFGMNLVSGLETSNWAFNAVVISSVISSSVVSYSCLQFISGKTLRKRAAQRLDEIETITRALSDMCALDQTLKETVSHGKPVDKETFRNMLEEARPANNVTQKEVDLLFDVFDRVKDGNITSKDLEEADRYRREKSYRKNPSSGTM